MKDKGQLLFKEFQLKTGEEMRNIENYLQNIAVIIATDNISYRCYVMDAKCLFGGDTVFKRIISPK